MNSLTHLFMNNVKPCINYKKGSAIKLANPDDLIGCNNKTKRLPLKSTTLRLSSNCLATLFC